MKAHVLNIAYKFIKEEFHWLNNLNNTPTYKAGHLYHSLKHSTPLLGGIDLYFN